MLYTNKLTEQQKVLQNFGRYLHFKYPGQSIGDGPHIKIPRPVYWDGPHIKTPRPVYWGWASLKMDSVSHLKMVA